jgi:hypothetical protein
MKGLYTWSSGIYPRGAELVYHPKSINTNNALYPQNPTVISIDTENAFNKVTLSS